MRVKWQPENAEGHAVVCDRGGRSARLVRDPNGAQPRWLGLGDQSRPQILGPGEHSSSRQRSQWRRSSSKRVSILHGARSARLQKMKATDISSAFRISLASWRAVPCPKKQSGGGVTHSMCSGAPCGGRKSRRWMAKCTRAKDSCEVRSGRSHPHCGIEDRGECQSADRPKPHEVRRTDKPGGRYRNPHCGGSFGPRGARDDRGGSVLKTSLNSKVTAFWKARSPPFRAATRRRPLQRDETRSSMIVFG